MSEPMPIAHADLRALFERLDRASMERYQCDHTYALTRTFLIERALPAESILTWLGTQGAGCDCEVMFNAARKWEEIVGYEPPDDE